MNKFPQIIQDLWIKLFFFIHRCCWCRCFETLKICFRCKRSAVARNIPNVLCPNLAVVICVFAANFESVIGPDRRQRFICIASRGVIFGEIHGPH